jgi:hypothetical protein
MLLIDRIDTAVMRKEWCPEICKLRAKVRFASYFVFISKVLEGSLFELLSQVPKSYNLIHLQTVVFITILSEYPSYCSLE